MINLLHCCVDHNSNNNTGDNLLYGIARNLISHFIPEDVHWETISQWSISSADSLNRFGVDGILFGGGGLILPDQTGASCSNSTYWQIDIPTHDYPKIIPPYFAAAVGYNWFRYSKIPPNAPAENLESFVRNSSFFGARNHGTIDSINRICDSQSLGLSWLPCPTTLMARIPRYSSCIDKRDTLNESPHKICGVNLPADRLNQRMSKFRDFSNLYPTFEFLKRSNYKLVYLAHKDSDLLHLQTFPEGTFDEILNISSLVEDKLLQAYCQFDLILGGRGHSLMIPFGLHIPIISITTHDKQKFFMSDANLLEYSIEYENETDITILQQVQRILPKIKLQSRESLHYQEKGMNSWRSFTNHVFNAVRA